MSGFIKKFILLLLCSGIVACGKDDEPPEEVLPDPKKPSLPFNEFQSTDATLQATYHSSIVDSGLIGKITYFQGIAIAHFRRADGAQSGPANITAEGTQLKYERGLYQNDPGSGFGIDFGSTTEWTVEGNAYVPDFDVEIDDFVPEIGNINLRDSLDSSQEFKLAIDMESPYTKVGQLDSVNYRIVGKKNRLLRKTASMDGAIFSTEELASLGEGKAFIQVEGFRYQMRTYDDYEVTFVNKGVFNKAVWVY